MSESWNGGSRFPAYRRSKTVLGEIGEVTKRKNSLEVNKLGAKLRLMGREMEVVNNEIRHQQAVLEVKASSTLSARRLSASAANTRELLIRHEQDNMQAISQKCKDFLTSGNTGQEIISQTSMESCMVDEGVPSPAHKHSCSSSDNSLITSSSMSSSGSATDPDKPPSSSSGLASDVVVDPAGGRRERKVGVVHNMDVHLELDSSSSEQDAGFFPGRKEQRLRRGSNAMWESLSKPKFPVRSKRELEVKHQEEMQKIAAEEEAETEPRRGTGRRRSLPVILGRSITRHDRKNSRSRDNLLLPEVGRNRSVSPDVRIRVKYADDKDDVTGQAITDIPFTQRFSPRQLQPVQCRSGAVSPRPSSQRLEIDLSLPVASLIASPRPHKVNKIDKAIAE